MGGCAKELSRKRQTPRTERHSISFSNSLKSVFVLPEHGTAVCVSTHGSEAGRKRGRTPEWTEMIREGCTTGGGLQGGAEMEGVISRDHSGTKPGMGVGGGFGKR